MYAGTITLTDGTVKKVSGTYGECETWLTYYGERNMVSSADIRAAEPLFTVTHHLPAGGGTRNECTESRLRSFLASVTSNIHTLARGEKFVIERIS